jgi:hypothetical protein
VAGRHHLLIYEFGPGANFEGRLVGAAIEVDYSTCSAERSSSAIEVLFRSTAVR